MEKKTVIINVETADGVKELDRLSAKFDEVYGDVLPLTAAIGELEDQLYQMAIAGEKDTQAFKDLSERAGQLKKTIMQVDMEVDALSMTAGNKLGGALGGVTAGFELVQGAMGAMGAESEKVQQALLKVQSAMAIAQGVQGIKEAIPTFKALGASIMQTAVGQKLLNIAQIAGAAAMRVINAVMSMNPIGLVVTAVTALGGAFYALTQRVDKAALAQKELQKQMKLTARLAKESQENLTGQWESYNTKTQQAIDLLKAKGATDKEIYQAEKDLIDQRLRQMDVQRMSGTKLTKDQYKEYQKLKNDSKILDAEYTAFLREEENKRVEDRRAKQKQLEEDRLNALQKQREENSWQAEEIKMNRDNLYKSEIDALYEQNLAKAELEKQARDKKLADDKAAAEKEKQLKRDTEAAKLDLASQSLSVLNDLVGAFAGKNEKSQKRAFNIQKSISIAQAVMDTYKGANAIFASAAANPASVLFPAQPFIQAGLAVAAGLANVKKIASTQFGGGSASGGGGGGSSSSGSSPNVSASMPANFNVVGNSGVNQLAQSLTNQPIQAYVVAGDVTTAQSMDRNKVKTASL